MNKYIQNQQGDFQKAIDFFQKEISTLRTGRANPSVLEDVQVEAYGTKQSLSAVGNTSVSDGQSMVITPWDKSIIKNIEKALVDADLGLGVVNEGDKIRITVPRMTEENRKELVKKLNEKQEAARIKIRQVRDEAKDQIEAAEKGKEITEDDKFRFLKELDEDVKNLNDKIKEIRDKKEVDIMTV